MHNGIGKRATWLRAALISLLLCGTASAKEPIRIELFGEENNIPYAYLEDGVQPAGIYVRILREAFRKLPDYHVSFAAMPFKRGMDLLQSGQIFGYFPPYYRESRDWIERYSVPILQETVVAICNDDYVRSHRLDHFPRDFKGARFANNAGYRMAGAPFFDMVEKGDIELEEGNTTESNLRFLMAGRVDCYVNERMAILAGLRELRTDPDIARKFNEVAIIAREFGYVAFGPDPDGKWPYRDQFANDLDRVLLDMKQSGEIDRLVTEYFAY